MHFLCATVLWLCCVLVFFFFLCLKNLAAICKLPLPLGRDCWIFLFFFFKGRKSRPLFFYANSSLSCKIKQQKNKQPRAEEVNQMHPGRVRSDRGRSLPGHRIPLPASRG